ncbi:acyltransferase [Kluyvera ascorbata]|uniref:acyltransferase n=1 Tax=Kluyvera ascorbata TaxID=51288 RepID=UPI0039F67E02
MATIELSEIKQYSDEQGNEIKSSSNHANCKITFRGSNNKLTVADGAIINCVISFDCNNAIVEIGSHSVERIPFRASMRVGEDARITIGNNVTCTSTVFISAVEGACVEIGEDSMIASGVVIRSDDAHPIFDVETGRRLNPARDVKIGNHVWLGDRCAIMSGSSIGDGSIIGIGSIVKKKIPNNSVAAGVPAKVIKKNVAWERPHLSLRKPFYKNDASTVTKSDYWNLTEDA